MRQAVGFIYLNGLNDGRTTLKDRVVKLWWRLAGLEIQHAHINWYDGSGLKTKIHTIQRQIDILLDHYDRVVLIGSSAGGSLALNVYAADKRKDVYAVIAHGRLRAGDYPNQHRQSLYRRAHLDSALPSHSFFDSVTLAEQSIPHLTPSDKKHLFVLTQLTDMVVPLNCMGTDGVRQHRSIAFGHSGGFVAHFIADRHLIYKFAIGVES